MWLLCIEAGFVGFLACLGGWIWYGFGRDGLARRSSPAWFIAAALFFSLMCFALPHYPRP